MILYLLTVFNGDVAQLYFEKEKELLICRGGDQSVVKGSNK